MLILDVDGVLTDGHLINVPGPDGKMIETKAFDSQDGIALQWLSWHGIQTGVVSGRISPATEESRPENTSCGAAPASGLARANSLSWCSYSANT